MYCGQYHRALSWRIRMDISTRTSVIPALQRMCLRAIRSLIKVCCCSFLLSKNGMPSRNIADGIRFLTLKTMFRKLTHATIVLLLSFSAATAQQQKPLNQVIDNALTNAVSQYKYLRDHLPQGV